LREDSSRVSGRLLPLLLLLAVVFAVLLARSHGAASSSPDPSPDYVADELLVSFRLPLPPAAVKAIHLAAGAQVLQHEPLAGWYRIRLPQGVSPVEAAAFYDKIPWVKYAEPNYVVRAALVPNDPLYSDKQAWYYDLINAPAGWDIERGEASVIVGVRASTWITPTSATRSGPTPARFRPTVWTTTTTAASTTCTAAIS